MTAREELGLALWRTQTLRGLADCTSPKTRNRFVGELLTMGWRPPGTEDPRISEIRAAVADFERHGANGPRTPGQMLREVLDILDLPDAAQPEGPSPWDAYVKAYREYQDTDPHGAAAHPTAHHMHALEAALRVAQSLPDSVTEWGARLPGGSLVTGMKRNTADEFMKGCPSATLLRREVGPWTELQP